MPEPDAARRLELVTRREAAAIARVSVRTIERAISRGDLHAGGTPGRRLILLDELRRWLNVDGDDPGV